MTRPLILLKMTLPGASGLYYGEEIEMEDDETQENLEKDPVFEYDDKVDTNLILNSIKRTSFEGVRIYA